MKAPDGQLVRRAQFKVTQREACRELEHGSQLGEEYFHVTLATLIEDSNGISFQFSLFIV